MLAEDLLVASGATQVVARDRVLRPLIPDEHRLIDPAKLEVFREPNPQVPVLVGDDALIEPPEALECGAGHQEIERRAGPSEEAAICSAAHGPGGVPRDRLDRSLVPDETVGIHDMDAFGASSGKSKFDAAVRKEPVVGVEEGDPLPLGFG